MAIPVEKIEKYEKEISRLVSQLDEREQTEKKIKELTAQLKDILCQLDELHVYVYVTCGECGEQIDIASAYDVIEIE